MNAVSCLSASTCDVVGDSTGFKDGILVVVTNGKAGATHVVKSDSEFSGIACGWTKGTCVAPGAISTTQGVFPTRAVIKGTKVKVTKLPATAPGLSYECASIGHCIGFGVINANEQNESGILTIVTRGHFGSVTDVHGTGDVDSVACVRTGSCAAYASVPKNDFILRTFTVKG